MVTKKDNKDFGYSAKFWSCNNDYIDGDVKVRDHCHITGKYGSAAHRNCISNVKLNRKSRVVLHNQREYDFFLLCKNKAHSTFKKNVIPSLMEKYMSFKSITS